MVTQVDRICPLCDEPLFYKKGSSNYKNYELAHIYPLNPTAEEASLLKDEETLSDDVNDVNNIIPLCKSCHGRFDRPRTVEEYRQLVSHKKQLLQKSYQQSLWKEYKIEEELTTVIESLYTDDALNNCKITFHPKEVEQKLGDTISKLTKRKIANHVTDYFVPIREKFAAMDQDLPDFSESVSAQIKSYYMAQKRANLDQQEIYDNIASWIRAKTKPQTNDAPEILTSFFVQNCEVFE